MFTYEGWDEEWQARLQVCRQVWYEKRVVVHQANRNLEKLCWDWLPHVAPHPSLWCCFLVAQSRHYWREHSWMWPRSHRPFDLQILHEHERLSSSRGYGRCRLQRICSRRQDWVCPPIQGSWKDPRGHTSQNHRSGSQTLGFEDLALPAPHSDPLYTRWQQSRGWWWWW